MIILSADTIENTATIRSEVSLCLDVNTDRAILYSNKGISYSKDVIDSCNHTAGIVVAGCLLTLVRVGGLRHGAIISQEV